MVDRSQKISERNVERSEDGRQLTELICLLNNFLILKLLLPTLLFLLFFLLFYKAILKI